MHCNAKTRPGASTPRRCQFFGSGSVLGSCFWVKNLPWFLPRFLEPVLEPPSVRFSVFMRSPEFVLDIPRYPQFWSIFVDIPWFSRSFWSVLLEPSSVLEPVLEPSSVRFSALPSCQELYFGLCHGLFQRVQISTLQFRHRSIPPRCTQSWGNLTQSYRPCLGVQPWGSMGQVWRLPQLVYLPG